MSHFEDFSFPSIPLQSIAVPWWEVLAATALNKNPCQSSTDPGISCAMLPDIKLGGSGGDNGEAAGSLPYVLQSQC